MKYKKYKDSEWYLKFDYGEVDYDYDKMIYVDKDGEPITGLLENYYYFKEYDPKNWCLVIDGKRDRKKAYEL